MGAIDPGIVLQLLIELAGVGIVHIGKVHKSAVVRLDIAGNSGREPLPCHTLVDTRAHPFLLKDHIDIPPVSALIFLQYTTRISIQQAKRYAHRRHIPNNTARCMQKEATQMGGF
jgi:hypothetical protein